MAFIAFMAGDGAAALLAFFIAFMAFGMVENGNEKRTNKMRGKDQIAYT